MSQEHLPVAHVFFRSLLGLSFAGAALWFCSGGNWPFAAFLVVVGFGLWVGAGRTGSQ